MWPRAASWKFLSKKEKRSRSPHQYALGWCPWVPVTPIRTLELQLEASHILTGGSSCVHPMLGVSSGWGGPPMAIWRDRASGSCPAEAAGHLSSSIRLEAWKRPKISLVMGPCWKAKEARVCRPMRMAAAIDVFTQEKEELRHASICYLPPPSTSSHGAPSGSCHPRSVRAFPLSITVLHSDLL